MPRAALRPGDWIALTEIDDLFGHSPLTERARDVFGRYVAEARELRTYDFEMGRKLAPCLQAAGFDVLHPGRGAAPSRVPPPPRSSLPGQVVSMG